jgi:hypothetical protein
MRKAALLVALAVVLSGCGALGGSGGTTSTAGTPAGTASTAVDTTETPAGIGDGSEESEVFFGHLRTLEDAGYVMTLNQSGRTESRFFEAASPGGMPILTTLHRSDGWSRTYYASGEDFGVTNRSGALSFAQTSIENGTFIPVFLPGGVGASPGNQRLASYVVTVDYEQTGARTVDGTEYTVYEASGTDAFVTELGDQALPTDRTNTTGFSSRLLVDGDGVIRQYRATYEYPDGDLHVNATVSAVGEVQVQQPDWLPAACQSTDFDSISVDCEQGLEN